MTRSVAPHTLSIALCIPTEVTQSSNDWVIDTSFSVITPVYTHTHTLITTLQHACYYDEIKGTQDLKIYSSHADSLHDSLGQRMIIAK